MYMIQGKLNIFNLYARDKKFPRVYDEKYVLHKKLIKILKLE